MKEKKVEMKKTIEMIKQNNYEKKNSKNTIPEALSSNQEKEIKEETIQRMDKFTTRPKNKFNNNKLCKFCTAPNWNPTHKCPALEQTSNNCGKSHFARACRSKNKQKRKIRNVTENQKTAIGEETDESESSTYRIEIINRIVAKNKYVTTK